MRISYWSSDVCSSDLKPLQGSLLYPCSSVQIRGKKKSRRQRLRGHGLARREAGDGFGDGADMVRRGAAAAADEVEQAGFGELLQRCRHFQFGSASCG